MRILTRGRIFNPKPGILHSAILFKTDLFLQSYSFLKLKKVFIQWIVDLNYLRTFDRFYPTDRHFYPLDSTIQASCNAISALDKIYPSDSDLSGGYSDLSTF